MAADRVPRFYADQVVAPAEAILCLQAPDGELVLCDRLGPGLVQQVAQNGSVFVRWVAAGFEMWIEPEQLQPARPDARLVVVSRIDRHDNTTVLQHKVVQGAGLQYNWRAELRPANVVRVLRADGAAWTFRFIPITRRLVTTAWSVPPEDDDAEAFMVAELSLLTARRR